jgi:hypothetical protein
MVSINYLACGMRLPTLHDNCAHKDNIGNVRPVTRRFFIPAKSEEANSCAKGVA